MEEHMRHELPQEGFSKIEYLLKDGSHYLLLALLLEGRVPGRI
jgi:hypothetical protein